MNLRIRAKKEKRVFSTIEYLLKYKKSVCISYLIKDIEYCCAGYNFKFIMDYEDKTLLSRIKGERYYINIEEGKVINRKKYHSKIRKEIKEMFDL